MIKENDRVKTLVESEGYKLDLSELLSLYPQMANIVILSFGGKMAIL